MRLPVKRALCTSDNTTMTSPESVTIDYTVRFSVLSAGRLAMLSHELVGAEVSHNATDRQREDAHYFWETTGACSVCCTGVSLIHRQEVFWEIDTTTSGHGHALFSVSSSQC